MKNNNSPFDILEGNPVVVFFYYSVPWVLALLCISSTGIVDGLFLGRYVGSEALAAVNLILPVISLIIGVTIMMSVGGSVRAGKYIGEGRLTEASAMFTKSIISLFVFTLVIMFLGILFNEPLVKFLGARGELFAPSREYFFTLMIFQLLLPVDIALSFFVRADGRPVLASSAMIVTSVLHLFLDWLFIAHWGMGVKGAAMSTGVSHLGGMAILLPHFFSVGAKLRFIRNPGNWGELIRAGYNGLSEFANEMSTGIIIFMFNWIMITRLGPSGVAAFTVVNFLLFAELMLCYGISDTMQPLVSTNMGAKKPKRILSFLITAICSVFTLGVITIFLLLSDPERLIGLFLKEGDHETLGIALNFISILWAAFLFNGINIAFSAYFTAMERPLPSAIVSLSRSLVLPGALLFTLPLMLDDVGIYMAIPLAELITLFFAGILFMKNRPFALVRSM